MHVQFVSCLSQNREIILPPSTAHECWENKNKVSHINHLLFETLLKHRSFSSFLWFVNSPWPPKIKIDSVADGSVFSSQVTK